MNVYIYKVLFVHSYPSVGLGCYFGLIQLLPRLKSLQIGIHEVSDFPEVVLDIF